MIDLTINKTGLEHNIERAKAQNIIIPTLEEMQHPEKVPEKIQEKLKGVGLWDVNPLNLFRITWKNEQKESGGLFHGPNYIVLPSELTGVKAKIICMINTPPCYSIYFIKIVTDYLISIGGVDEMYRRNLAKAKVLYDYLDSQDFYKTSVKKEDRSLMNVTFRTGNDDLDAEFIKGQTAAGFSNLKGHKLVGGMRASIYNAMPIDGVEALVKYMFLNSGTSRRKTLRPFLPTSAIRQRSPRCTAARRMRLKASRTTC